MIKGRRRFKQTGSLKDRLTAWAEGLRNRAQQLEPGPERDAMLKKARQADTRAHLVDWANSPGLKPPIYLTRQKLRDIAASGPVVLTPDLSKLRVVGLTREMAESYVPVTITVSYAGQDGAPKPFFDDR